MTAAPPASASTGSPWQLARTDLRIIADLVRPDARVLDLGCGTGDLLAWLGAHKAVNGYGLDIDPGNVAACLSRGVNVLEHDLDAGLTRFGDDSFDMVVMTETLQAVRRPDHLLGEMLRIGTECVVTFPNFGHWRCRLALAGGGMPVVRHLPHAWHDTPNIRLCTLGDFEALCADLGVRVIERRVFSPQYRGNALSRWLPNLFGAIAFYRLGRPEDPT